MKRKIMWSLIGSMIVASLILVSCAGGGGNGDNGGNDGNGEDEPQYGRTITAAMALWQMKGFDPLDAENNNMLSIIFDRYYTVPWEKGPAGTGEFELNVPWYPRSIYRGELLEDFEVVDPYTVKYRLRQGLRYWNKAPVNGREITVDDIMWNSLYASFNPGAQTYLKVSDPGPALQWWTDYLAEIESGKYTDANLKAFLSECKQYTPEWESYYPGLKALVTSKYSASYALLKEKGYDVDNLTLINPFLHKIDKYNFVARGARCSRDLWSFPNAIWPTPPEITSVDGFTDWETLVANGPWIPTSYDPMGETIFVKNKDYWQYDPVHPENQLPYADELRLLMIEDETTYYAALQTAQLDVGAVSWYKINLLLEDCPAMLHKQNINECSCLIFVRNDIPPFNDIRVRHACMLAIDHQAIINDYYKGNAQILTWPEQPQFTDVYTPLNQLPAETQELFTYNPTKARALLAEAGYPDGFSTQLTVYPSSEHMESCMIVQDYLKAVGIYVKMLLPDAGSIYAGTLYGRNYEHMISCPWGNNFPGDAMNWAEGGFLNSPYNFGRVDDPQAYETGLAISCLLDDDAYYAAIKADNVRRLGMMYQIILPTSTSYLFWWPWLKGYHGEWDLGLPDIGGHDPLKCFSGEILKYLWVDQDLKDEMGY